MSQKIAFVNGKGGTGKTTLSMLVAAVLASRKNTGGELNVGIDDRDPQQNATAVAEAFGVSINPDAELVIIDTSPDIEKPETVRAIREADLVVIVTRPESFDLISTIATAQVIQRERNPAAKTVVVFNQVRPNTIVGREILDAKAKIPFPTLKTVIHQRASYSTANRYGFDRLEARARAEILELCIELLTQ